MQILIILNVKCTRIAEIPASYWKSRNTMVTSDFRPEVEIWPFRTCAVKICNITLIMYYRNSSVVVDLLWGRYRIPQNIFLLRNTIIYCYINWSMEAENFYWAVVLYKMCYYFFVYFEAKKCTFKNCNTEVQFKHNFRLVITLTRNECGCEIHTLLRPHCSVKQDVLSLC